MQTVEPPQSSWQFFVQFCVHEGAVSHVVSHAPVFPVHVTSIDAPGSPFVTHVPPVHVIVQLAFMRQSMLHMPPGQSTVHVDPASHVMLQFPAGHCRSHI